MSDTYGGGLNFGSATDAPPGVPNDVTVPSVQPPGAPSEVSPGTSFGSALRNVLPGPNYRAPDPQASALDQTADTLQQRIERANKIATNPIAQFFAPQQVQAARNFVPQATEALLKIQQQKSAIASGRTQAETLGLTPGEASDQASQDDRLTIASSKALKGDMRAFQGLQAVAPERAAAIAPQVHEVIAGHLEKAQLAFDSLAGMTDQGQYRAKLNQLRQDGTLTDLESLGLKVPPTFDAFNLTKAAEGKALRDARIGVDTIRQKLEERNTYQPMEKKEAETYNGRLTTLYGDQIINGQWGRNGASGTRGLIVNGAADPNDLGKKFTLATPEQRKAIKEEFSGAVPEKELEKYRDFSRTYKLATTDKNGKPISPDAKDPINTNPNVQQGIAEGLASMLRGGSGGATAGLLNIETGKRGLVQAVLDKIITNYAGGINTLSADQVKPYLSQLTQQQQRAVLDGLKDYSGKSISDRTASIAERAGALGLDTAALGLGKNESTGVIGDALEIGRRAQVERMKPNHQAIGGGDGVLQLGAQRAGSGATQLPPGTTNTNQLPGGAPLQTPVQQASVVPGVPPVNPPPTSVVQPGGTPTAPSAPVVSPTYTAATQRIESGGTRDPWTATTKGSTASGAFQMLDRTWSENKPAGAPERAKDATPEQQTQAFNTLTAKNATALQIVGLPVSDTNLYVAHNLGATGGAALLKADPNADARTVVGEAAARNNPIFFKGRPTVATALARYQEQVAPAGAPGNPMDDPAAMAWQKLSPEQQATAWQSVKEGATDLAPAIGSTVGAIGGGLAGGPVGGVAGGAAGGATGQALKDYLKGNAQSPREIAKQAVLGGVLGVASEARPVLAMAGRVAGAGSVEAGDATLTGGSAADAVDAGMRGTAEAVGGEAFGRALGMAGHKVFSLFAPDARIAVRDAAKSYAEASKVLETEPSRLPGADGAAGGLNPKYEAAEHAKAKAETTLKDAGLNPDEAAYAHQVSSEAVPKQEAQAAKPGVLEKQNIGRDYQQLETEVGNRGVGTPKATPKLADGPIAAVASKQVSAAHTELAEHVEAAITAPAKNWQDKWVQLKDARSDLLQAERDALSSTATGRTKTADDMRKLADTVRTQQAKVANFVFGPKNGPAFMDRLKTLDTRYRNLMEATNGGDLAKAAAMKGEAGREADRKFRAFAHDDPSALAAWTAMRREGPNLEKDVKNLVAVERIPYLGKLYSAAKLMSGFSRWMRERTAGSPAKFSDFIKEGDNGARATRDVLGTIGARTAVQGDVLNGAQ